MSMENLAYLEYNINPLGTGDFKFDQSQELSTFWGL